MNKKNNPLNLILFVDSSVDFDDIIKIKNDNSNIQIFTFDYISHQLLIKNNVPHKISDTFLSESNLDLIQEKSYQFAEWYKIPEINNYQNFENIDLGSLFKIEFFVFLLPFLKKMYEIFKSLRTFATLSSIQNPYGLLHIKYQY